MTSISHALTFPAPVVRSFAVAALLSATMLASPLSARADSVSNAALRMAQASTPSPKTQAGAAATESKGETVEQRITTLHASLKITPDEQTKWDAVAQAMRLKGKITNWNSSAILKLNPQFKRALKRAGRVTPVYRSDGSGDSYAFQHYLTVAAGGAWGLGYSTSWGSSAGIGENGNSGVAAEVRANKGTIGYISAYYLINQKITTAAVENAARKFEFPQLDDIADAAKSNGSVPAQGAGFSGVSIVYPSSRYKTAYPISTYTYAIVNKNDSNLSAVKSFLNWVISPTGGLFTGTQLDFAPLPGNIRSADATLINSL